MKTTSVFMSLVIAIVTALVLVIILHWGFGITSTSIWYLGLLLFFISFVISLGALEMFLFREIHKLSRILEDSGSEDKMPHGIIYGNQSFQNLRTALLSYAEIKQMEIEQLKNMAAYRREFLADISHELKTPIFAAQGFVHTLLDGAMEDPEVSWRFLKKAAKSLDGLDALVQDLLTLSRLETGQVVMDMHSFNIYDLTLEVFEQLEQKAHKKGIKLGFGSGVYKNAVVIGDYHRISQVMRNLILNGINYTGDKGKVTVDFDIKWDQLVIHVEDNGKGIPERDMDRIFERFYRVEKSRGKSKDRGGSGLGLAIVKHILEQHSSQIKVRSVLGKGSDFYFSLPKGEEDH